MTSSPLIKPVLFLMTLASLSTISRTCRVGSFPILASSYRTTGISVMNKRHNNKGYKILLGLPNKAFASRQLKISF